MNRIERINIVAEKYINTGSAFFGDFVCLICGSPDGYIAYKTKIANDIEKEFKHQGNNEIVLCDKCDKLIKQKEKEIEIQKLRLKKLNRII